MSRGQVPWSALTLDFIVVGNARTGTSSLFDALGQHPLVELVPAPGVELDLPRSAAAAVLNTARQGAYQQRASEGQREKLHMHQSL